MDHRLKYTTEYIQTDFGHLAYHYAGNIAASKVFVHVGGVFDGAMSYSHELFKNANDGLLRIFVDVRAHGSSTRIAEFPSITERTKDLETILDSVYAKFPNINDVYLSAYSQGAVIALNYLTGLSSNHKIRKLFLISPRTNASEFKRWFTKELEMLDEEKQDYVTKKYNSKGFYVYTKEFFEDLDRIDLKSKLNLIHTDIEVFTGLKDQLTPYNEIKDFFSGYTNGKVTYNIYKSFDHILNEKQFDLIWKRIYKVSNKNI